MVKTVLITGCSDGGIGQSLAEHFAKAGCHVYATARRVASMSALEPIDTITRLELDVCSAPSIASCVRYVERSTGGRLDVLVNNAGISYTTPAVEMDMDTCREVFEANVFAVMAMNKAFAGMLIRAKGTILATGSLTAILPNPWGSVYHTSKAALHMYNDCLRMEMEPFGVRVVTAVTGGVQSNISANAEARFKLSENSIYKPVEKFMVARLNQSQAEGTCSRPEYAAAVVRQTLQTEPPARIYKGKFSSMVWFLFTFMPYSVTAYLMARRFGMVGFKAMLNK